MSDAVITIEGLTVDLPSWSDRPRAVEDVSLKIMANEILCVVGESGSGKSVTSLSILNLLQGHASNKTSGVISFQIDGKSTDLLTVADQQIYNIRGRRIAMVFQEPMSALNPVRRCGNRASPLHGARRVREYVRLDEIRRRVLVGPGFVDQPPAGRGHADA